MSSELNVWFRYVYFIRSARHFILFASCCVSLALKFRTVSSFFLFSMLSNIVPRTLLLLFFSLTHSISLLPMNTACTKIEYFNSDHQKRPINWTIGKQTTTTKRYKSHEKRKAKAIRARIHIHEIGAKNIFHKNKNKNGYVRNLSKSNELKTLSHFLRCVGTMSTSRRIHNRTK